MLTYIIKHFVGQSVHIGHSCNEWNPRISRYLVGSDKGIHIIDLEQTLVMLKRALRLVEMISKARGFIIYGGANSLGVYNTYDRQKALWEHVNGLRPKLVFKRLLVKPWNHVRTRTASESFSWAKASEGTPQRGVPLSEALTGVIKQKSLRQRWKLQKRVARLVSQRKRVRGWRVNWYRLKPDEFIPNTIENLSDVMFKPKGLLKKAGLKLSNKMYYAKLWSDLLYQRAFFSSQSNFTRKGIREFVMFLKFVGVSPKEVAQVSRSLRDSSSFQNTLAETNKLVQSGDAYGLRGTDNFDYLLKYRKIAPVVPECLLLIERTDNLKLHQKLVRDCIKYGIPIIGLVDSSTNPMGINYPIPGNDQESKLFSKFFLNKIIETRKKEIIYVTQE